MSQKLKEYLIIILWGVLIATLLVAHNAYASPQTVYVTQTYTVQSNDSLETISEQFIVNNTGTIRRSDEFREGIRQLNYDVIGEGKVKEGQVLQIGYWTKNEGW